MSPLLFGDRFQSKKHSIINRVHPLQSKCQSRRLKPAPIPANLPVSHFALYQPESRPEAESSPKTLIILFGWLFSNDRHLDKYRHLYLDRGFHVLSVRVHLRDFLLPKSGCKLTAHHLVAYLTANHTQFESIFFVSFSIGCYQLGELFMLLNQNENEEHRRLKSILTGKIRGIIYDSPVDVSWAPIGVALGATSNRLLQWSIATLMKGHLLVCHQIATKHYIHSSEVLRKNEGGFPILMFLSRDDPITNCEYMFDVMDRWRQKGTMVMCKCWDESAHVGHYYRHPREYCHQLDEFLRRIGKVSPT